MDISIVIPAFDEGKKIAADIEAASKFLLNNHFTGEIIIVDDGSSDDTSEAARKAGCDLGAGISLQVERLEWHCGKGCAVRRGIRQTGSKFAMFADSGCCVPYENVLWGLDLLKSGGCDIAHGSRKLAASKIVNNRNWYRGICSAVFRWFIRKFMNIPPKLTDTQCGFKVYRGDVAHRLYGRCITNGFMFDVEVILRALKAGYRIKEFPIEWSCDADSRLNPLRSLKRIFGELITIKGALAKG